MRKSFEDPYLDRVAGSVLGLLTGDALGMPVEGWDWPEVEARFGWLDRMVPGRLPAGSYTDDGQMAVGLLESLVEAGGFDPALCAARWLANFEPQRGYGGRIKSLMDRLAEGQGWDKVGTNSFGNGAAMRIGPLGVWYGREPDLSREELIRAAKTSARITHRHPQAVAGAVAQALAVARACSLGLAGRPLDPEPFLTGLVQEISPLDPGSGERLKSLLGLKSGSAKELRRDLAGLFARDVRAVETVYPALAAVLMSGSFSGAVELAVNLGGDTDTLGAMAGAVAGAYYGAGSIPAGWLGTLENGARGRDYVIGLCREAARIRGTVKKI